MFTPSTLPIITACQEIADTVGASADTEMTTRALRSLAAAVKYLNGRYNWSWLQAEGTPVSVVAPFGFTLTAASGQASASAASGHGLVVGDVITGPYFALGTRLTALGGASATALHFNRANTYTGAGNVQFSATSTRDLYDLPSDFKQPYTVKLLTCTNTLLPAQRRMWDRSVTDEFQTGTPQWYDLFPSFERNKLRLLPPPAAADTLLIRYYRRMTVPSASGDATVLDIPQDYDFHLMAWAKWHFLVDKAEGRSEQASTWLSLAQEGIKQMIADQTRQPDETLGFYGHTTWPYPGRGSTSQIIWEYS